METVNGADGPPPPLPPQSVTVFKEGIGLILSRWWALNMAIENEWGGRGSRAIADQLSSDIFSWFTQSREPLYIDDLEDILHKAMLSLNIMAEDGSVEEVAEKLMIMHEECLECNYQSVVKMRESSSQTGARSHVRQVADDDSDDDSTDGDEDTSSMMVDAPEPKSNGNPTNVTTSGSRPMVAAEDDGWTVVSSRRNKGKRN